MFSNFTIGLVASIGFAAWVYSKVMKTSGGNVKNSLIVAGFAALGFLAVITTFLSIVL